MFLGLTKQVVNQIYKNSHEGNSSSISSAYLGSLGDTFTNNINFIYCLTAQGTKASKYSFGYHGGNGGQQNPTSPLIAVWPEVPQKSNLCY